MKSGGTWETISREKQGVRNGEVMENREDSWRDTEGRDAVGDRVGTHRGGKIGST